MKTYRNIVFGLTAIFLMLISCDNEGDESMSWRTGTGLHIIGPNEVEVGEEEAYYVDAFTTEEDYVWTLNGTAITPIRNGEFVQLTFDAPGANTLSVSNGQYSGTLEITVE